MKICSKKSRFFSAPACIAALFATFIHSHPAKADFTSSTGSQPHGLQTVLSTHDHFNLYDGKADGFNLAGGFFSGRASGITPTGGSYHDDYNLSHSAELEDDQHMYAVMIDGRYNFNGNGGKPTALQPYVLGGMGMAMFGSGAPTVSSLAMQSGDMATLFRVGGGVTYHMGAQLDMSMDYKAGFSGIVGEQTFASHVVQPVGTHTINVGMHYQF